MVVQADSGEGGMKFLISENDLMEWTGYQRRADLIRFLRERRVEHWITRSGAVCTTLGAVEGRLIEPSEDFEFEMTDGQRQKAHG